MNIKPGLEDKFNTSNYVIKLRIYSKSTIYPSLSIEHIRLINNSTLCISVATLPAQAEPCVGDIDLSVDGEIVGSGRVTWVDKKSKGNGSFSHTPVIHVLTCFVSGEADASLKKDEEVGQLTNSVNSMKIDLIKGRLTSLTLF